MTNLCPHCVAENDRLATVEIDGWRLTPNLAVYRAGTLHLTGAEAALLHALATARGNLLSPSMIGKKFSNLEDNSGSVRVIISRLRKKLGESCPIETIRGLGYRWRLTELKVA